MFCRVPGCENQEAIFGICRDCQTRYLRGESTIARFLLPGTGNAGHRADMTATDDETPCAVPGCGARLYTRGICGRHYAARKRDDKTGDEARRFIAESLRPPRRAVAV